MKIDVRLLVLVLSPLVTGNFIKDPKCPPVSPRSPAQCRGQRSNCWSPGVRDLDCPASGLCCYDGCANTCVARSVPLFQKTGQLVDDNMFQLSPASP